MLKEKKVLFIGGKVLTIYNQRKEIINTLISEGSKVYIVSNNENEGEKIKTLKKMGATFIEIKNNRRSCNPFLEILLLLKYIKIIKKIKPNIILCFTAKPNIYGGIASILLKVDYINNITGLGSGLQNGGFLSFLLKKLYKAVLKKSKCIFFQNEENLNFFRSNNLVIREKIKLIPGSGVNLEEFKFQTKLVNKSKTVILFIGRVMKEKGINEYLETSKIIFDKKYNVEFQVLGDFQEKDLGNKVLEYEAKGYLKYLGTSNDVREQIRNYDVVVNPSYHEGMSNVLLEAGAMGKLLLGSNISGIKEIIEPVNKNLLFEKQNVEDMVETIEKVILLDKGIIKENIKNQIEFIEKNFSREIIVEEYMKIINTVESCRF